jgi:arylsulfatase A-like enzyme
VVGAAYLLALVVRAATTPIVGDDAYTPGLEAKAISDLIVAHYGGEIARIGARLAVASIVGGAALGMASGALVDLRDRAAGRGPRGPLGRGLRALVMTAVLHGWALAWMMARRPQPFVDAWYAVGGSRRAIQILVSDTLGPSGIAAVGLSIITLYLAGSRARLRFWAGTARAMMHAPSRLGAGWWIALVAASLAGGALWGGPSLRFAPRDAPQPSVRGAAGAGSRPGAPAEARPNVLILAADGLRFDALVPRVAPNLSAAAERGTRFERAYVSIPHTVPSWVTLLTGRDPHHHGVRSIFPRFEERARDLDALPTRLARAGYFTAVVADFAGDRFHDIDLGWLHVDAPTLDFRELLCQRALEHAPPILPLLDTAIGALAFPEVRTISTMSDPREVADGAIRAIEAAGARPFFVTAFFSTSHFPYAAPAPFFARFTDAGYRGAFKYHRPVGLAPGPAPDPVDVRQIRALYDGAVAGVDDAAGQVLAELTRRGIAERTIVVITSDHGEALFEHGRGIGHGDHLFGDEVTHVPLVIHDPRRPRARRESAVVRGADLAPSIYALTGVAPPADLDGRSLAAALDQPIPSAVAFAETDLWLGDHPAVPPALRLPYPGFAGLLEIDARHGHEIVVRSDLRLLTVIARHRMARDDRWKLIYAPTPAGARYFLYDTAADPDETRDV